MTDDSGAETGDLRRVSQSTLGHLSLAKQLFRNGRYSLALGEIERALDLNPELATAYLVRGLIAFKMGRTEDSRQSFLVAVKLDGKLAEGWKALAAVERELGDCEAALRAIDRALNVDPSNSHAYVFKGSTLQSLGRLEDAAKALHQAVRINPLSKVAHLKLGSILVALGNEAEAESQIVTAHRLEPTDHASRLALGDLLAARGETDAAIAEYKAVVELNPRKASDAQARMGGAYFQAGLLQEAVVSLKTAIRLDPKQFHAHLLIGQIHLKLNQPQEALKHFEAALSIDDRYPEAVRLRDETRERLEKDAAK